MKVAVLLTCHNRCDTTLKCLRHLFACQLPKDIAFDVWLNDDGCQDGTADAVLQSYPQVNVIKGSGADYWCGGMRRAWQAAVDSGVAYDGYLWLNDDTMLFENALELMLSGSKDAIVTGAICDGTQTRMTYGGSYARGDMIPINGTYRLVEKVHGNCVWIPEPVYEKMGNFQPYLTHALGDVDYSRRALRAGIKLFLTPKYVGACDSNQSRPAWMREDVPLSMRLRNLYSPLGYCEPFIYFRFCLYHDGLFVALKSIILQHIRVFFPSLWRKDCPLCAC